MRLESMFLIPFKVKTRFAVGHVHERAKIEGIRNQSGFGLPFSVEEKLVSSCAQEAARGNSKKQHKLSSRARVARAQRTANSALSICHISIRRQEAHPAPIKTPRKTRHARVDPPALCLWQHEREQQQPAPHQHIATEQRWRGNNCNKQCSSRRRWCSRAATRR